MAPHQLQRVARRGSIGIGRGGTVGGNSSGDIFLAFSVANVPPMPHKAGTLLRMDILNDQWLDPSMRRWSQSVEEAVINAMLAAQDMGGTHGTARE